MFSGYETARGLLSRFPGVMSGWAMITGIISIAAPWILPVNQKNPFREDHPVRQGATHDFIRKGSLPNQDGCKAKKNEYMFSPSR